MTKKIIMLYCRKCEEAMEDFEITGKVKEGGFLTPGFREYKVACFCINNKCPLAWNVTLGGLTFEKLKRNKKKK